MIINIIFFILIMFSTMFFVETIGLGALVIEIDTICKNDFTKNEKKIELIKELLNKYLK